MAIKRDDRYPGRWNPADADYPLGGPKNRTTPSAKDGSYFEKDWIADYEAFFGKLISDAGITPSNAPDTAQASQFHEAFIAALSVENKLKANQNFNVAGADGHISATPQTFTVGQEFAAGRFVVGADLVNATYTGGLINADSGSYAIEYGGDFTDNNFGIKLADDSIVKTGVSMSLESGNTRVTVDMSVAPAHKFAGLSEQVGVWSDINDADSEKLAVVIAEEAKRISENNGAAAFDSSGVLWQTSDLASASSTVGGGGWFQPGIGINQQYIDETASRSANTEYTNTEPVTIFVILTNNSSVGGSFLVNGIAVAVSDAASGAVSCISIPIPPGAIYEFSGTLAGPTWVELK